MKGDVYSMGYMRIRCDYCGGKWEIYHRDDWKSYRARTCPHCSKKIDPQTWERFILPAFGAVEDANAELYKDTLGYKCPLFEVDFIADTTFKREHKD